MKRNLISVKEIAQALGLSVQSIRRAYWSGPFPHIGSIKCCDLISNVSTNFFDERVAEECAATRRATTGNCRRRTTQKRPVR